MNIMPHLKKGLNLYIKDAVVMIISFLILPMALSIVYGGMQKNMFEGREQTVETIKVNFQYDESSAKGAILKDILSDSKVKELIDTAEENAGYRVSISPDFKEAEIRGKDVGDVQFAILKNFTDTVLSGFIQYDLVQSTVNILKINENERAALVGNIMTSISQNNQGLPVRENIVEGYKTLSSIEYYTISMFSFTSLLLIVTLASYFYKEVKEGALKRALSAPISKRGYFLGFLLNSFIVSLVISAVYVLINRLRGAAFTGNPLHLALIVLLQSLMFASAAGFTTAFIKREMTAMTVLNIVCIVPSMFGGVFFYGDMIDSRIMRAVMNATPNSLVLNSYKDLAITGSLQAAAGQLIVMAVLSIALITLSIIKIGHKWEV
jgi:ABC-type multidrug transport system permease subunit